MLEKRCNFNLHWNKNLSFSEWPVATVFGLIVISLFFLYNVSLVCALKFRSSTQVEDSYTEFGYRMVAFDFRMLITWVSWKSGFFKINLNSFCRSRIFSKTKPCWMPQQYRSLSQLVYLMLLPLVVIRLDTF